MDKSFTKQLFATILAIITVVFVLVLLNKYTGIFKDGGSTPSPSITNIPTSEYPEYDILKGKSPSPEFKNIKLLDKAITNTVSVRENLDGTGGIIETKGKIENAFLYIELFVDFNKRLTPHDDFYFKLNEMNAKKEIGGHLSPKHTKPIPPDTGIQATQLLYDMSGVLYKESFTDQSYDKTAYWIFELNKNKQLRWLAFVSTDRPGGVIQDITIYYKCSKDTPDCSINF